MVAQWIIMIGVILVALFFLKAEPSTKLVKISIIVLIGFIIYLAISGLFMPNNINLNSPRSILKSAYLYFIWIGHTSTTLWGVGTSTVKMVGNAIKTNDSKRNWGKSLIYKS